MTCIPLRLEAPGLDALDLAATAVAAATLDVGFPIVREEVLMAPDTDGSLDYTYLSGPRVITLQVQINQNVGDTTRWELVQKLKAYLNPRLRPSMFVEFPGSPELMMTLRAANFQDVWTPQSLIGRTTVTAQWVAPSGILESAVEEVFEVAAASGGGDGLDWPVMWPIEWGTASVIGVIDVTNLGDRDAFPILQLHGPWSGETRVENLTTGKALVFDGESVLADNYIEVDTRAKTIYLNGLSTQSRYHRLDFPDSDWFTLVPGVNTLRFLPAVSSSPARLAGRYRHAYS